MDLTELLGDAGLQQDAYSQSNKVFGKEGQLKIIGWSTRLKSHKVYLLKCSICAQDSELFGEGYFKSVKSSLEIGRVPCGCSFSPRWTKWQFTLLCLRKAEELGHTFLGFEGEWKGQKTKIKMFCEKHGEWNSGIIGSLINASIGCPKCRDVITTERSTKPNDVMISSFFDTRAFHPDTKFWRSERKDSKMRKVFWYMSCPDCGEIGESTSSSLQNGHRSCTCSPHRQQECYINRLIDENNNTVAIKFGIARDSKQRIKKQDRQSVYTLNQHSVYSFPDVASCKKAELECLQELKCGVVLKRDMKDGYTETTWSYNLDKIIEIYERNGGTKIE